MLKLLIAALGLIYAGTVIALYLRRRVRSSSHIPSIREEADVKSEQERSAAASRRKIELWKVVSLATSALAFATLIVTDRWISWNAVLVLSAVVLAGAISFVLASGVEGLREGWMAGVAHAEQRGRTVHDHQDPAVDSDKDSAGGQ